MAQRFLPPRPRAAIQQTPTTGVVQDFGLPVTPVKKVILPPTPVESKIETIVSRTPVVGRGLPPRGNVNVVAQQTTRVIPPPSMVVKPSTPVRVPLPVRSLDITKPITPVRVPLPITSKVSTTIVKPSTPVRVPAPTLKKTEEVKVSRPSWGMSEKDTEAIIKMLSGTDPVVGIGAPTGSGKSTTMVEKIVKTGAVVYVVEPTVVACQSLRDYMAPRLGQDNVATAAEGNVRYNNPKLKAMREGRKVANLQMGTQLVYCTSGHMRRIFFDIIEQAKTKGFDSVDLTFCDVLMLDEAHGGTLDVTVIMALWKLALESRAIVPKLVLASATMVMDATPFPRAPFYDIKIPGYPVTVEYAPNDYKIDSNELYQDTGKAVLRKHKSTPIETTIINGQKRGSTWMVFCPGMAEIENVMGVLQPETEEEGVEFKGDSTLKVLKAHSKNTPEEMKMIFDPVPEGVRHVIVATNIAEMSITIENLSGIFDTMTEKVGETSQSGGFRLATHNISKSSAEQRKGRTGRTCPGFCYRMCTKTYFDKLESHRPDEIKRVPLHTIIIETLNAGLDPATVYADISLSRLKQTLKLLKMLEMVEDVKEQSRVTKMGKFAAELPLSVRSSAVLWHWIESGRPLFPAISAVTLIDCYGPSYFWYPAKGKMDIQKYAAVREAHYEKYFKEYEGNSELEVLLKMWLVLVEEFKGVHPKTKQLATFNWEHSLNNKKVSEAFNIARQVRNTLLGMKHIVDIGPFNPTNVIEAITPILQKVYSDQIFMEDFRPEMYSNSTLGMYKLDTRNSPMQNGPPPAKILIALITAEIAGRGPKPMRLISLSHPIYKTFDDVLARDDEVNSDEESEVDRIMDKVGMNKLNEMFLFGDN